jgi:hypothetical protein
MIPYVHTTTIHGDATIALVLTASCREDWEITLAEGILRDIVPGRLSKKKII